MHWLVHQWAFDRQPPDSWHESLRYGVATLAASVSMSSSTEDYAMGHNILPYIVALFQQEATNNIEPRCKAY